MIKRTIILIGILLTLILGKSEAATRTISDAGGNWKDVTCWVEGAVPTNADAVVAQADGTSGNVVINGTDCVASTMVLTNYIGQMNFADSQMLTVTTTVTFVSGMTLAGTGTLKMLNTATITSGGLTFPGSLIFDAGTFTLADTWTVTGSVLSQSGTNILNTNTMNIGGSLTVTTSLRGSTVIVMNGTGTLSCASASISMYSPLTINTAGTITVGAYLTYGGTAANSLTYTAGTFDIATNSTLLTIAGSCTLNCASVTWNAVTVSATATIVLSNTFSCSGLLTWGAAVTFSGNHLITCVGLSIDGKTVVHTLSGNIDCNGNLTTGIANTTNGAFNINVSGNLTINGNTSGTATIILDGTGTWSHSTASVRLRMPLIINTAGTITLGPVIPYTGHLVYVAGTVDAATNSSVLDPFESSSKATLDSNGITWYDILPSNFNGTLTLESNLTCSHNFTIINSLTLSGAYNISCATFRAFVSTSNVIITLVQSQTLTVTNGLELGGTGTYSISVVSSVASTPAYLNYTGTPVNCEVYKAVFTDIDASGSSQGIDNWYGGTLTRTTNITNRTSADIGGGVAANDVLGVLD
jgi:hypothetical protein